MYDLVKDPDELHNLYNDPAQQETGREAQDGALPPEEGGEGRRPIRLRAAARGVRPRAEGKRKQKERWKPRGTMNTDIQRDNARLDGTGSTQFLKAETHAIIGCALRS